MINGIVTKVQALITAALPAYTKVDPFYTPIAAVDSGDHPYAMVYDPAVRSVRLRDRQKEQTITLLVLLIRKEGEGVSMRDDLDAVNAALEADPTLTQTVDDARAVEWGSAERQTARSTGGMRIEVELTS